MGHLCALTKTTRACTHMPTHTHTYTTAHTRAHINTNKHKLQYQSLIYIHITQESQNAAKTQKRENSICVGFIKKYLSLVSVNYV